VIPGVNGYLYREGDMGEFVRIVSDVIDGKLSFDTAENIARAAERSTEFVVVENIYRALPLEMINWKVSQTMRIIAAEILEVAEICMRGLTTKWN